MSHFLFLSSMVLFALSMCFTPGPNNALAMATGMDKGLKAALPFCLGAGVGANVTLFLLGLGLAGIFERFPAIYEGLRYVGAAYMLWLAWRISGLPLPWKMGKKPAPGTAEAVGHESGGAESADAGKSRGIKPLGFFQALMFQLVNVKVWLTNVIVISNYVGTGEGMWTRFTLALALLTVMGTGAMISWAAGGVFMRRFLTSDGMRRANYVFASFLVISVALLFI